jgi:hypothetical protein
MYNNFIPYRSEISTNDYDIYFKSLLRDIVAFHIVPSNHDDYDSVNNFSYLSYCFSNGKVIDNYGLDINQNNLKLLDNLSETDYMVTYRRDNNLLYRNDCSNEVEYWFIIKVRDCEPNYARLNTLTDVFIDSIINNVTNDNYTKSFTSEFTDSNGVGKIHTYTSRLTKYKVVDRFDSLQDVHNSKNFIYSTVKLRFKITKTITP